MLTLLNEFAGPIGRITTDVQAREVLSNICARLGFTGAFLIEYSADQLSAVHLIDTSPERRDWWPGHIRKNGLARSANTTARLLALGNAARFTADRFEIGDPLLPEAQKYGFVEGIAVPISHDSEVKGVVMFLGMPDLSERQLAALHLVAYTLFIQVRSLKVPESGLSLKALTPREKEVMRLAAAGMTSQEIAEDLGMSARTVNQHADNVADKLGTRNRAHTVARLIKHHMLA